MRAATSAASRARPSAESSSALAGLSGSRATSLPEASGVGTLCRRTYAPCKYMAPACRMLQVMHFLAPIPYAPGAVLRRRLPFLSGLHVMDVIVRGNAALNAIVCM